MQPSDQEPEVELMYVTPPPPLTLVDKVLSILMPKYADRRIRYKRLVAAAERGAARYVAREERKERLNATKEN